MREMYLYKILLIIIPLHIIYFAFIWNILILWGNLFYGVNIIEQNVNIPSRQMSRSTFI